MHHDLFRPQVLAWQQNPRYGTVLLCRPLGARVLTGLIGGLTLAAILFLAFNSYTRKVSVNGMLVPDQGLLAIRAPVTGIVKTVDVTEGQEVQQGARLFVLDQDRLLAGQGGLASALLVNLDQQRQEVRVSLANLREQGELLEQGHQHGQRQRQASLAVLQQLQIQEQATLALRKNALARAVTLKRDGHVADSDLDAARMQVIAQEKTLTQLQLQQQDIEAELAAMAVEFGQQQLELSRQMAAGREELLALEHQQVRLQSESRTEFRAPVDGHIGRLELHPGMNISAGENVLTLVPSGSRLVAQLQVPSHAMGFIDHGQAVDLQLDSFPYQKFGIQHGRISGFDTAAAQEVARPGQQPLSEFRVLVELEQQTVSAYGREYALKPGMQFTAEIGLDQRSLLQWLLEPLFSIGRAVE
jgi:membrane fusion protein